MLSSLPLELLDKIGNETARLQDRKSLRQTCLLFGLVFKPHVLAGVTLNIHANNLESGISLLETLAKEFSSGRRVVSPLIRTLDIEYLSPAYSPQLGGISKRKQRRYLEPSSASSGAEKRLWQFLEPALKSLHRLNTLRWHRRLENSGWTEDCILSSLAPLQSLTELAFVDYDRFAATFIPLPLLRRIRVLSINGDADTKHLSSLLSSASRLETLHLFRKNMYPIPFEIELPSTISDLGLNGWTIDVSKIIHNNLTSLDLRDLELTDADVELLPSGAAFDSLWHTLFLMRVHLRSLAVAFRLTNGFLDYIQSYSGLETLSVRGYQQYELAERFYRHALPMHKTSLVKLDVIPEFGSGWCFGVHNVDVFRSFRKLRTLSVSVDSRALDQGIYLLLHMISSALQDLEKVAITTWRSAHIWDPSEMYYRGMDHVRVLLERFARQPLENGSSGEDIFKWVKVYVNGERIVLRDLFERTAEDSAERKPEMKYGPGREEGSLLHGIGPRAERRFKGLSRFTRTKKRISVLRKVFGAVRKLIAN